jgi:hypothetical protein
LNRILASRRSTICGRRSLPLLPPPPQKSGRHHRRKTRQRLREISTKNVLQRLPTPQCRYGVLYSYPVYIIHPPGMVYYSYAVYIIHPAGMAYCTHTLCTSFILQVWRTVLICFVHHSSCACRYGVLYSFAVSILHPAGMTRTVLICCEHPAGMAYCTHTLCTPYWYFTHTLCTSCKYGVLYPYPVSCRYVLYLHTVYPASLAHCTHIISW